MLTKSHQLGFGSMFIPITITVGSQPYSSTMCNFENSTVGDVKLMAVLKTDDKKEGFFRLRGIIPFVSPCRPD